MVARNRIRIGILALVSLLAIQPGAEITTTVKTANTSILYRTEDEGFLLANFTAGSVSFKSRGTANVKGEWECTYFLADHIAFDIPRAYLKVRFPWFDLTAGKTRVSWGQGFAFNAGDVVFGSMEAVSALGNGVMWDQTRHLAALTAYFGNFTFLELLVLPGAQSLAVAPGLLLPVGIAPDALGAGARFVTRLGAVTCETGYLYKGNNETHNPYLSFQTPLFDILDFYLAVSSSLPQTEPSWEAVESLMGSCGLYRMLNLGTGIGLNLRLEAGFYPFAVWEEASDPVAPVYGLYLFPDFSLTLPENLVIGLRSLLSPVDGSGLVLGSLSWNPIQGFTLGLNLSFMFGGEYDTYAWGRERDFTCQLYLEHLFGG